MSESSISVCVRIRPFSQKEAAQLAPNEEATPFLGDGGLSGGSPLKLPGAQGASSANTFRTKFIRPIVKPMDDKVLVFDPPDNNPLTRLYTQNHLSHGGKRNKDMRYAFDKVFNSPASQQDVFQETCKPLLDGILNGFNASVFAYGATGCGKTHTISGSPENPGLIFLTMKELYQRIEDAKLESDVHVRLSYLEIYNETIRDLLSVHPTPPGQGLALREDSNNRISVAGITELVPENPESVIEYIQEGNRRRTMSPTEANAVSSRSHAVLQINVTQKPKTADTTEDITSASLNIIDLAGSERASATRNNGARMKEGANINKSLLALGNCINALCQSGGQRKHVPYRNSKLTRLLKFSLGGNCKTVMVVCISPSSQHYDETHNALKYANQAKNIRTKVSRNMINVDRHVAQYVQAIHELKEENAALKAKLAERGALETAAEKRKKQEMSKEMEEAKRRMRDSTDNVTRLVLEKAGYEAQVAAAEARMSQLKRRLQEVEAELDVYASKSETLPSDLEGEKQVLKSLIEREGNIAKSEELHGGIRSLLNSLTMQRGIIVAASHNQKFDTDVAETVKTLGNSMLAEIEAARIKSKYEAILAALTQGAGGIANLITIAARSTVALKEVAGELEYRSSHVTKDVQSDDAASELSSTLGLLASQLRSISTANDQAFVSIAGKGVGVANMDAAPPSRPSKLGISSSLRRPRNSLTKLQSLPEAAAVVHGGVRSASAGSAVLPNRGAAAARTVRRASVAVVSGKQMPPSPSKPTSSKPGFLFATNASQARAHAVVSPRKSVRRSSVGGRRTSGIGLVKRGRASLLPGGSEVPEKTKKAFRWADEAGEGTLDDKGMGSMTTQKPDVAPIAAPKQVVRDTDSSSVNDWEDEKNDLASSSSSSATTAVAVSNDKPLSTATQANTTTRSKRPSIFDRNFLTKRKGSNTLDSVMESDDQIEGLGLSTKRQPFSELANQSLPLTEASFSVLDRAAPYNRQSLSGPVRRKGRSSLSSSVSPPSAPISLPRIGTDPPTASARLSSPKKPNKRTSSLALRLSSAPPTLLAGASRVSTSNSVASKPTPLVSLSEKTIR